jgi:hypothetical protein
MWSLTARKTLAKLAHLFNLFWICFPDFSPLPVVVASARKKACGGGPAAKTKIPGTFGLSLPYRDQTERKEALSALDLRMCRS